jgi:hypothetical protein
MTVVTSTPGWPWPIEHAPGTCGACDELRAVRSATEQPRGVDEIRREIDHLERQAADAVGENWVSYDRAADALRWTLRDPDYDGEHVRE